MVCWQDKAQLGNAVVLLAAWVERRAVLGGVAFQHRCTAAPDCCLSAASSTCLRGELTRKRCVFAVPKAGQARWLGR